MTLLTFNPEGSVRTAYVAHYPERGATERLIASLSEGLTPRLCAPLQWLTVRLMGLAEWWSGRRRLASK